LGAELRRRVAWAVFVRHSELAPFSVRSREAEFLLSTNRFFSIFAARVEMCVCDIAHLLVQPPAGLTRLRNFSPEPSHGTTLDRAIRDIANGEQG